MGMISGAWRRSISGSGVRQSFSFFRMCLARFSLISLCRGTGCDTPVRGLRHTLRRPPCLTSTYPRSPTRRIRSCCFIQAPIPPLSAPPPLRRLSSRQKDLRGGLEDLPSSRPACGNREILLGTRAIDRHLANKCSEPSCLKCKAVRSCFVTAEDEPATALRVTPGNQRNRAAIDFLDTPTDLIPPCFLRIRVHLGIETIEQRVGERGPAFGRVSRHAQIMRLAARAPLEALNPAATVPV